MNTKKSKTFHKNNCECRIRESIIDICNRNIVLSGRHAFEWSVSVITKETTLTINFPSRKEAVKEFKKYKPKKK